MRLRRKALAQLFRTCAGLTKGSQTQCIMSFGKADAVFVGYEVAVVKRRRGELKRAVEQ